MRNTTEHDSLRISWPIALTSAGVCVAIAAAVATFTQPTPPEPVHVGPIPALEMPASRESFQLDACPTEDSTDCYWDATAHGNGEGRSFIDLGGVPYYLP